MAIQYNRLLFLFSSVVLAGCTAGDGNGLDTGGRPISPTPPANSDFQQIQDTIFTPICSVCHAGANAPQGLRLDAGNSYALLVNVASAEVPSLLRVNPGNPDTSYIVHKIQGTASVGVRMPANGPPYLTQAQIDLIRGWIAAGAPAPSGAAPNHLVVTSSIPAAFESATNGLAKISVVFNGAVDSSRVDGNSFQLRDAADQRVFVDARVPPGRQNVVELTTRTPLESGTYLLTVSGDGPAPLADEAGHTLDGDADGKPGGDTLIPFDVNAASPEGTVR